MLNEDSNNVSPSPELESGSGDRFEFRMTIGQDTHNFSNVGFSELVNEFVTRIIHNFLTSPPHRKNLADILDFDVVAADDSKIIISDPIILREIEEICKIAIDYLIIRMILIVESAVWGAISEAFVYAVIKRRGKGIIDFKTTQMQAETALGQIRSEKTRRRMRIKKESGLDSFWTTAKIEELTILYKKIFAVTRAAKSDYRIVKKFRNWQKIIKENYPELPDFIIDKLDRSGKTGEPANLTREYLSPFFNDAAPDSIRKKLIKAKKN